MIHYIFSDPESGELFMVAQTWPVWRQMVEECAGDDEPVEFRAYDDEGMPVGPAVTL